MRKFGELAMNDKVYVLCGEPLQGYSPDDINCLITDSMTEYEIAIIQAEVHNKIGNMMHELDSVEGNEYDKLKKDFKAWENIDKKLFSMIVNILKKENETAGSNHVLSGIGTYYIVKPFMERNGYIDGSGWWVKDNHL